MLQTKDTDWLNGYKNKIHIYADYQRPTNKGRGWGKIFHANGNQKKAAVAVFISNKTIL